MRYAFVTFGCRLNRAEALEMEAAVSVAGHDVVPVDAVPPPDFIVVRGCSVTAKAQHDCEKELAHLRSRYPASEIIPTGCLPAAAPLDRRNTINGFNGLNGLNALKGLKGSRAFLKIQDGCSGKCTYCIVPQFRGSPVSVPFDLVLDRARTCLAAGFREIVVTGCNLALYRDGGRSFADLLAALAALPPPDGSTGEPAIAPGTIHRVRIGSLEPGLCDEAVLETLAAHGNICRHLHLSLQSASNRVLRLMNRPYSAEEVAEFCLQCRQRIAPDFTFGADVIAGFPGETDADHAATAEFLSRQTEDLPIFTNIHVFPYSERPGTPATTFVGTVPMQKRKARAKELQEIGHRNRNILADSFIGRKAVVCIEKGGSGWTDRYLRCVVPTGLPRRRLVQLRIISAQDGTLYANADA